MLEQEQSFQAQLQPQVKTASSGKRFANYLLDLMFLYFLNFLAGIVLGVILIFTSPEAITTFEESLLTNCHRLRCL